MQSEDQVRDTVDHLFRHQAGQMVSVLARHFGIANVGLIEDAVQDAMIAALKKWPYSDVPENQSAWLIQVAKNRVLDQLRRGRKSESIEARDLEFQASTNTELHFDTELNEDQLRMIFACCHPAIPSDSQVALTLKIVGGFSVAEIARAYLAKEEAVAKLLTRAKQKLRSVQLEIPSGDKLRERLDSVLRVLYLMFSEGYTASEGDHLLRRDLSFEAIRLTGIIADHPKVSNPKINALAALFLFQAARFPARADGGGELLLLADQDRSKWDTQMIAAGLQQFRMSAAGNEISDYHLEAEIASLHSLAPDFVSTDWMRIIECYNELQSRKFSPVVALNRAVAIGQVDGAEAAMSELSTLAGNYLMTAFNLFHITKAHFLAESGDSDAAMASYERAIELTRNESIRRFLTRRIAVLTSMG